MTTAMLSIQSTYSQSETKQILEDALKAERDFAYARFVQFEKECQQFERAYGMDSSVFWERFEAGELGDDEQWFDWYAVYRGKKLWGKKYNVLSAISWNE